MYRFLLSRRWLGLLAAAVLVATTCVLLGFWQLDRLTQRHARNDVINDNLGRRPVPVGEILHVGRDLDPSRQYARVRAVGSWDPARQLLVRNRPFEGAVGFYVLTPLRTEQGPALLVDRGWVPAGETATTLPVVPPPPAGTVTVIARARASEPPATGDPPPTGQVTRIDSAAIARALPYDVYGGFADLVSQQPQPAEAPKLLPAPEPSEGPHLAYALQWFLFAGLALGAYVVFARREAADRAVDEPRRVPEPVAG